MKVEVGTVPLSTLAITAAGTLSALTWLLLASSQQADATVTSAVLGQVALLGIALWDGRRRRARPTETLASVPSSRSAGATLEAAAHLERQVTSRFADHLHDTAVQSLLVATYLTGQDDPIAEHLAQAERALRDVIAEAREVDVRTLGLAKSCSNLSRQLLADEGLTVTWVWDCPPPAVVPVEVAHLTYRFFREALCNVAEHAGVTQATASLRVLNDCLTATVFDAGAGFDPATVTPSGMHVAGLDMLHRRAALLGGRVEVRTAPGIGTEAALSVDNVTADLEATMLSITTAPDPAVPPARVPGPGRHASVRAHEDRLLTL